MVKSAQGDNLPAGGQNIWKPGGKYCIQFCIGCKKGFRRQSACPQRIVCSHTHAPITWREKEAVFHESLIIIKFVCAIMQFSTKNNLFLFHTYVLLITFLFKLMYNRKKSNITLRIITFL